MIQRFECHAGGQRAVADDGHDPAILAALRGRDGHAQRGADRGAGVADAESVVFALAARRKRREPGVLFDGVQLLAAPGQYLVRVGLMPHIPDQTVVRGVEYIMQRNGQFNGAQSGGEMAAAGGDAMNQKLAQFLGQFREFGCRQLAQVRRVRRWFRAGDSWRADVHITASLYCAHPHGGNGLQACCGFAPGLTR